MSIAHKNDEQRREYQRAYYQAHKDTKKRSKTSYETKKRYESKVYTMVAARVPKDLAERFRTVTAERGDSQAAIIKEAITNYLNSEQNAEPFKINPKK